jgi:hypothetical protein
MAVHSTSGAAFGGNSGTSGHASGFGGSTHKPSDEDLEKLRLKKVEAYITDDSERGNASEATAKKRAQRQKEKDAGKQQYVVKVGSDAAKVAIKGVADAILRDPQLHSTFSAFVESAEMLDLFRYLATSGGDVPLIAEIARRGDLLKLAAAAAANSRLSACCSILAVANDDLLVATNDLALRVHETKKAGGDPAPLLEATVAAARCPAAILHFVQARERGDFRARVLRWVLRASD